jgi:hypothetical protein
MLLPCDLTEAEREWLARERARPCKHGHPRLDARLYRNRNGSLWLDCAQCVRKRMEAYRRPWAPVARKRADYNWAMRLV